ncbi:MAG: efflux RND transporter permease subunit [Rhodospirillaceae bacterium]|nr:efflux RND transporter permease subunit [Rhodospirillaceae bacterium]
MTLGRETERAGVTALFIRRPILALVMNLLVMIAGLAALRSVEVRELPNVDRPVVSIRTTYTGAAPETVDAQITSIIESAVARVQGVASISSQSSYGQSRVTVEFSTSADLNIAAGDVREAVASITRRLPKEAEAPTVVKADADASPIIRLAVSAQKMSIDALTDLVQDRVVERLAAVSGVADVTTYGDRTPAIRVAVNQVALASRGLTMQDVVNTLAKAQLDTPSGTIENRTQSLIVRTEAPVITAQQVAELYINDVTRIRDIAQVRAGSATPSSITRVNGRLAIGVGIVRQAQSNTLTISQGVQEAVAELKRQLPQGVDIAITSDDAVFIRAAITEVVETLFIATGIVILIIFLFLASIRSTLIPAISIPVSLLGTIAGIWLAGFSINIFTLFALVLSTGMVVDDAIVVLENIERRRHMGLGKRAAAVLGTREIFFAVISTTATLAAVFIPISFLPGTAGGLFAEFGFVLAFAVTISSFVALSLCPVLAARLPERFGRKPAVKRPPSAFARAWARAGAACTSAYAASLEYCLRFRLLTIAACVGFAAVAFGVFQALPQELTPSEDRGVIFVNARAAQGVNLGYMSEQVGKVETILDAYVKSGEVTNVLSFIGRGNTNQAFIIASLAPWSDRKRSQQQIQAELQRRFAAIPSLRLSLRQPNSLGIRGAGSGLNFAIVGSDYAKMADAADKLIAAMSQNANFTAVQLSYDTTQPQINVRIDREAATKLGIAVDAIATVVRTMVDEYTAAQLFVGDKIVDIILTGGARPINDPGDVENLFIKARDGRFIPLSSVVTLKEIAVAPSLGRESQRRAVPITASLAEGYPLSQAIADMRAQARAVLPQGMGVVLLGEAQTLEQSAQSGFVVFGFAILIVFLVLAAQFENVVSAVIIMLTVPFGLAAAVYAILLTGGSINYYSQIGLVLLVGIVAKNGILVVEFANQLRDEGMPIQQAVREAARIRLRPVMMTMISTVLGGLPLVLAFGAGAEAREALGWIVVGGLGFATIFTLYLIPVFFSLLAHLSRPRAAEAQELESELAAASGVLSRETAGDERPSGK